MLAVGRKLLTSFCCSPWNVTGILDAWSVLAARHHLARSVLRVLLRQEWSFVEMTTFGKSLTFSFIIKETLFFWSNNYPDIVKKWLRAYQLRHLYRIKIPHQKQTTRYNTKRKLKDIFVAVIVVIRSVSPAKRLHLHVVKYV